MLRRPLIRRPGVRPYGRTGLSLLLAAGLAACGWPKDPEHTAEHVQGKLLRAGVSENPPWIRFGAGGAVEGIEANLIRAVAADAGARVQWVRGGEGALMKSAKAYRLDIVAGGITSDSPWSQELGAPHPYAEVAGEKHLLLTPPGENAWLLVLDRAAHDHHSEIVSWISQETTAR